jgi:hypothetical protein
MPTYEYYCPSNQQTVEVLHGMNESIKTWGVLSNVAGIDYGDTSPDSPVERKLSAVSLLPKRGETGPSIGGCGTGCGCVGH